MADVPSLESFKARLPQPQCPELYTLAHGGEKCQSEQGEKTSHISVISGVTHRVFWGKKIEGFFQAKSVLVRITCAGQGSWDLHVVGYLGSCKFPSDVCCYPVCRYEGISMSLFCPSMVNINLPCSDSQRPEHDKIPAMCLTCLWFDIVISFFSPIKSKSVSNPFFPNSFFSKQGMKTFPFLPQSPYWEGSGVKPGVPAPGSC